MRNYYYSFFSFLQEWLIGIKLLRRKWFDSWSQMHLIFQNRNLLFDSCNNVQNTIIKYGIVIEGIFLGCGLYFDRDTHHYHKNVFYMWGWFYMYAHIYICNGSILKYIWDTCMLPSNVIILKWFTIEDLALVSTTFS